MTTWWSDSALTAETGTRLLTSSWSQQSAALISRIFISSSDLTEERRKLDPGRMTESPARITQSEAGSLNLLWISTWRTRISELKTKKFSNDPVLNWTESKDNPDRKAFSTRPNYCGIQDSPWGIWGHSVSIGKWTTWHHRQVGVKG